MKVTVPPTLIISAVAVLLSCLAPTARASSVATVNVPEPGSIALLGTGLLVCGRLLRRKRASDETAA